jgi:hypothetical protein
MICIGIDQSYTDTGIAISIDGAIKYYTNENFKGCQNRTEKRKKIKDRLEKIIKKCTSKSDNVIIILERIRTFTSGSQLLPNYLKMTGALISVIVDLAYDYEIKVYSVDTRAWKSKIVGKANSKGKDKKLETIEFVKNKYNIDVSQINSKGKVKQNDNIADAICISLYGFIKNPKLNLEE